MKYKSSKRKKRRPSKNRRSWLQELGSFLMALATFLEVVFKIVVYLLGR